MTRQVPWRRVLAEGAVIVASILLAFGLDAWWVARGERQVQRAELAKIREELIADRARLETNAIAHEKRADAALLIIERISDPGSGRAFLSVADSLLVRVVSVPTFTPLTPVLTGLRQAGRVEIIEDAEVRQALAVFDRSLTSAAESEMGGRNWVYNHLVPALSERGDVGHVLRNAVLANNPNLSWAELGLDGDTRLGVDLQLKGLLSQRFKDSDQSRRSLRGAHGSVGDLISAIEQALAR